MNKYSDIKNNIYNHYKHFDKIDSDNITDVNDHITDELGKNYFENTIDEFYVTTAMCTYMIENDLYDEYFFDTFNELLEEFNNSKNIMNIEIEDELNNDIDNVSDYLKKEITKEEYYNKLSEVYESELNALDEENM